MAPANTRPISMEGIECVPLEREIGFSGKQVVHTTEKELVSNLECEKSGDLPLPWLGLQWARIHVRWLRTSLKYRVLIAIAIGAFIALVLGIYLGLSLKKSKSSSPPTVTSDLIPQQSVLFYASAIPTATSLPTLPVGSFNLETTNPQRDTHGCLSAASEATAWSCDLAFQGYDLAVRQTSSTFLGVSLEAIYDQSSYGVQVPVFYGLKEGLLNLALVTDLDNAALGPAYHFQTTYDKVVLLPDSDFPAPTSRKRSTQHLSRRGQLQPGDQLWACYWNGTLIEGFFYVESNSTQIASPTSTLSSSPSSALPSTSSSRFPNAPFATKIEERRLSVNSVPGYCQKMQLLLTGNFVPLTDTSGNAIVVRLDENDPNPGEFHSGSAKRKKARKHKREDPENSCHCQWMW
ncbi:hypothetical protein BU16DRAFT_578683 [Lophium mytilinum]|uniref:DUF7820 domain-containing protein n=1 Tax=Lophium mytilinum TaxID=390894 RepID=A0A6A6R7S6_9PEZI|nr:hypothetical protein BU16DRAFT_578683 [Lophium mytilinum]